MEAKVVFILIFSIVYSTIICSTATPQLITLPEMYEVRDGEAFELHHDSVSGQRKTKVNLERLEVVRNDLVFGLPFESCIEEKMARDNKYAASDGHNSRFKEVHQQAGFHHVHRHSMPVRPHCVFDVVVPFYNSSRKARIPGEFCIPEHVTGGAAVGDYDGDGLEDIYFTVSHDTSVLYRNNGDGTFSDVTQDTGIGPRSLANGAVWADFDQDGDLDLYVTTVGDTRHYLYINYGGHFREEAMERNCSMQTSDKRKLSGMTPNVGDFDRDGFVDIYVTEWIPHILGKPSTSRLLRNKGYLTPGYFEDVTSHTGVDMDDSFTGLPLNLGTYAFGSSFTDFDNDGWQELLVTADYGSSRMFWNTKRDNFSECTESCGIKAKQDAMGHAIGDWDNDGYLDWFSSAIWHNRTECSESGCKFDNKGNVLFRNLGSRRFKDATDQAGVVNGGWGWGAAFVDFDNNGFLDFVMTSGIDFPTTTTDDYFRANTLHLWKNLGAGHNGKTQEVSSVYGLNGTGQGRGLLKWDYDDDGDEDIIVCNNFGEPFFYQNLQLEPNNWIRIRVMHRCSRNHDKLCDSLGARVQVISESNHTQTQEIGSSTHFLGQSSLAAHFGLGPSMRSGNVTVKVRWPSIPMEVTYVDVPPNTRLRAILPSRRDHSAKTLSYSSLDKCFSLRLTAIVKQPAHSTATINPDGKTVQFQLNPGVNPAELGTEAFTYSVSLEPSPKNQSMISTAMCLVTFTDYRNGSHTSSECMGGRRLGPAPSVTDERRLDGISYNQDHVWWGAAMENVARELPAMYADGIAMPAGTCTPDQRQTGNCRFLDAVNGFGSHRPSPRNISNELFRQIESKISSRRLSDLHSHFGQFLAHDTDFSSPLPRYEFQGVVSDVWLPIEVPKGDVQFDPLNKGNIYLPFVRSTYNRCTGRSTDTPRQQVNKITSYIDGSVVYGESEERNRALREFKDGKMKVGPVDLIPDNTMAVANDNPVGRDPDSLLAAGDSRANVQPGLIALHTLFVREHNRLCDEYKRKYPMATDEQLFQAARRLVAAELQAMTFREYLPSLLGGTKHIPRYQGYNRSVDAGMSNIMATAAFRFGHSQVNTHLWRYEENGTISPYGHLPMRDAYFAPERVKREGGIDPLFRGAVRQAAQEIDLKMVDDMRNVLFPPGRAPGLGLDLAAMNIQRGRDHGLPDYNSVRKAIGLKGISSFTDVTKNKKVAYKIKDLYHDKNNIDLWVGGLAEDHEEGSELGPTFRTIVMRNFLRIRDGDRFWYERYLSKEEIDKVNSLTLGRIIRLNTGFKSAPDDVFFSTHYCAAVKDFQCITNSKNLTGDCVTFQHKLTTLERDLVTCTQGSKASSPPKDNNISNNSRTVTLLIFFCVVHLLAATIFFVLFLKLWFKFRRRNLEVPCNAKSNAAFEMNNRGYRKNSLEPNNYSVIS